MTAIGTNIVVCLFNFDVLVQKIYYIRIQNILCKYNKAIRRHTQVQLYTLIGSVIIRSNTDVKPYVIDSPDFPRFIELN